MTKEQFLKKWVVGDKMPPDLEAVIATEIAKVQEPQPSDKVQISKHTLVEVNRAFRALKQDRNSYIHKVFSDDGVFDAIKEISEAYKYYFGEQPQEKPAKPFDKERFEAMFRAVVASGVQQNFECFKIDTTYFLQQLDAYYTSNNN